MHQGGVRVMYASWTDGAFTPFQYLAGVQLDLIAIQSDQDSLGDSV